MGRDTLFVLTVERYKRTTFMLTEAGGSGPRSISGDRLMFHVGAYQSRSHSLEDENKTRIFVSGIYRRTVTVNEIGIDAAARSLNQCCFVAAEQWRYGSGEPFCNAPAAPGSAYCVRHLAHCAAERPETGAVGEGEAPPPPELGFLAEVALPELIPDDPREIRALLDVEPPGPGDEE
jgi:hypothetical protein